MLKLKSLMNRLRPRARGGRKWPPPSEGQPWFDRPDALQVLDRRRRDEIYDEKQCDLLRKWITDGYVVIDGYAPVELIDAMQAELDDLWTTAAPVEGLTIEEIKLNPDDKPGMSHSDLVKLDMETRMRLKTSFPWRIHGFSAFSQPTREIFLNERLREAVSLIFDRPVIPQYTINFTFGSRQHLHQDTCVFFIQPNFLIGLWLACEDAHPDSGPLVYYPGSHKEPMWEKFDNYPQTNLKTCDKATTQAYESYLEETAKKYERKQFLAKKGQILLWHGMLIHGGDTIVDPSRTRKSFVTHYIVEGVNKADEVHGPFNW